MLKNDELASELESIRLQDPELRLHPKAVVAAAQSPTSRLHGYFEWDDEAGAAKYRITQARQLIRVVVTQIPGSNDTVRAFVNLTPDRGRGEDEGGGYRSIIDVMGDVELRAILMRDALGELKTFERKYSKLVALGPVFDAYQALIAEEEPANRRRKKSRRASAVSKKAKKKAKKAKAKKKAKARR